MRGDYGNFSAPPLGYIWDFAQARRNQRAAATASSPRWDANGRRRCAPRCPASRGSSHPSYPPFDMTIPDATRADIWLEEFRALRARRQRCRGCRSSVCGSDHTSGTSPGAPTPRAMVADNDLALGRIVEAISHSRYWKESAIFVIEDDAQNGPDHVDAHRSVAVGDQPVLAPRRRWTARSTRRPACCGRWS